VAASTVLFKGAQTNGWLFILTIWANLTQYRIESVLNFVFVGKKMVFTALFGLLYTEMEHPRRHTV